MKSRDLSQCDLTYVLLREPVSSLSARRGKQEGEVGLGTQIAKCQLAGILVANMINYFALLKLLYMLASISLEARDCLLGACKGKLRTFVRVRL
jgi:hypothetical protein